MEDLSTSKRLLVILIVLAIGLSIAFAAGLNGAQVGPISVFFLCALIAFLVNWIVFIPSNISKTEHYFDLTGSITYLSVIALGVYLTPELSSRAKIAAAMVTVWTIRLGLFLFTRINRAGNDDRFDKIKVNPLRFFTVWTLQGLWVILTIACALAIITGGDNKSIGVLGIIGIAMWLVGFVIEVVADFQKSSFKKDPKNKGQYIKTGLWSWSRHPNYFGEILLWTGIAVLAMPILHGWEWVVLISPVFVFLLLTRISGIPALTKKGQDRWGDDAEYQEYLDKTSLLVPMPPK